MQNLKHVGRLKGTNKKCMVVFRTLPGDAFNSLVVLTEGLEERLHDPLITLVESNAGQSANEFAEVLARSVFPNGETMLPFLHLKGFLKKVPTDQVEMLPNNSTSILLSELNQIIATQAGISVQDLAIKPDPKANVEIQELASAVDISPKNNSTEPLMDQKLEPLSDTDLAKKYRSDADRLAKEAANLRRMAEELVPTKKKAKASSV